MSSWSLFNLHLIGIIYYCYYVSIAISLYLVFQIEDGSRQAAEYISKAARILVKLQMYVYMCITRSSITITKYNC